MRINHTITLPSMLSASEKLIDCHMHTKKVALSRATLVTYSILQLQTSFISYKQFLTVREK